MSGKPLGGSTEAQKRPRSLIPWLVLAAIAVVSAVGWLPVTFLIGDEFLVTYFGVFLGLALTVDTFLFGAMDTLLSRLGSFTDPNAGSYSAAKESRRKIVLVATEIRHDTAWLFGAFVAVMLIAVVRAIDHPIDVSALLGQCTAASRGLVALGYGLLVLSLFALHDLMGALFAIVDATMVVQSRVAEPPLSKPAMADISEPPDSVAPTNRRGGLSG